MSKRKRRGKPSYTKPTSPGAGVFTAPTMTEDPWINLMIAVVERAKLDAQGILWYGVHNEVERIVLMQEAGEFLDYMRELYAEDTPRTHGIGASLWGVAWRNA